MAYISYVPESQASPELKKLYERYRSGWGGVDHILKIHSHNPESMRGHHDFYRHLMHGPSPLSRAQREMIAVTVSRLNQCYY